VRVIARGWTIRESARVVKCWPPAAAAGELAGYTWRFRCNTSARSSPR
jgi:hypothetical protein